MLLLGAHLGIEAVDVGQLGLDGVDVGIDEGFDARFVLIYPLFCHLKFMTQRLDIVTHEIKLTPQLRIA